VGLGATDDVVQERELYAKAFPETVILEMLKDSLISEREFSKSVLNLSYLLDDIGVDPGLSSTQVDQLLNKPIENEERARWSSG